MQNKYVQLALLQLLMLQRAISRRVLPSGRVLEEYSESFFAKLDYDASFRMRNLKRLDAEYDAFTPQTGATANHSAEITIYGNITFSSILTVSDSSIIFTIAEHPHALIKYQMDCPENISTHIHPLLRDAWYGYEAHRTELAPEVFFVSPPALPCPHKSGKCGFDMAQKRYDQCASTGGVVRYMIMARGHGINLFDLRKSKHANRMGALNLQSAFVIGARLMHKLSILHTESMIIHGDIHPGNILVQEVGARTAYGLRFVDFGSAQRINIGEKLPETPIYPSSRWFHRACTQWQIRGYAWSRRDDIMKALYTIFQLMHPRSTYVIYESHLQGLGIRALVNWKEAQPMYKTPDFDPIAASLLPEYAQAQLYELMNRLLVVARSMNINGPLPYTEIMNLLSDCFLVTRTAREGILIDATLRHRTQRHVLEISQVSGRVVEAFNAEFIIGLDKDARNRYSAQVELDRLNEKFTPNVNSVIMENTPLGYLMLGELVHTGLLSLIYEIEGHPNLLIKYGAYCTGIDNQLPPLLRDAWYGEKAHALGIGPKILFVSPPSLLYEERIGKCGFTLPDNDYGLCRQRYGSLRYMIMERIDAMTLRDYRGEIGKRTDGALPFVNSMIIGYFVISLVEKLHTEARILHNNIQLANIIIRFTNVSTGEFDFKLIDFGSAEKIPDGQFPETQTYSRGDCEHETSTQWQIDGYEWTQRDDVLKAIQAIAQLMHPFHYLAMEEQLGLNGYDYLRKWKTEGNWFIPDPSMDPIAGLEISAKAKNHIYGLLERILILGRGMQINKAIPYDEIKHLMSECVKIVRYPSYMDSKTTNVPSSI